MHPRVAAFQNVANPPAGLKRTEAGFLHALGFGGHDLDMPVDLYQDILVVHFRNP